MPEFAPSPRRIGASFRHYEEDSATGDVRDVFENGHKRVGEALNRSVESVSWLWPCNCNRSVFRADCLGNFQVDIRVV